MFVYHEYYQANKVALVYPGSSKSQLTGHYLDIAGKDSSKECSVITIPSFNSVALWQEAIANHVKTWIEKIQPQNS